MGEGRKERVEETGAEEGVGFCGGDGYLEDGLVGNLRGSRVWRKAGREMVDMLLEISRNLESNGVNEEGRAIDGHLPNSWE